MYCSKCGKFIGTDVTVCDECRQKEAAVKENESHENQYQYANYCPPINVPPINMPQSTVKVNLGKAIAAMILATVGFIFTYIGIFLLVEPVAAAVFAVIGLVPSILGLVFGIQSILNFKKTAYLGGGKRIPVLILGILSVVDAGLSLFLAMIVLLLAGAM